MGKSPILTDLSNKELTMSKSEWDVASIIAKAIEEAETNKFSLKR